MTQELPEHTVIRPLGIKDLEAFLEVEELGFPPEERCSEEKARYRLTVCPELTAGVFIREFKPVEDDASDSEGLPPGTSCLVREKLIGHVLATKMESDFVEDVSMELPELDEYYRAKDPNDPRGHKEAGRTIGIHSVVVHPSYQGRSIATLMLRDYIQRLTTQHTADRIALLAHDRLVPFYARLGFIDDGPAKNVTFGGGGWRNLWLPLASDDEDDDDQDA